MNKLALGLIALTTTVGYLVGGDMKATVLGCVVGVGIVLYSDILSLS